MHKTDLQHVFRTNEERLGPEAQLGVAISLFDSAGRALSQYDYRADQLFPMASIVKIPIAMALASKVATGAAAFEDCVQIRSSLATPGPVSNPLDRLYFCPFELSRSDTLSQMLSNMLRYSDNTAADIILRQIGGVTALREYLACPTSF